MLEKKTSETEKKSEKKEPMELNLDDLDMVQGGSLSNVSYTSTSDISGDTKSKI